MKKTIKKNVKMRLDELIKYVWDNNDIFKGRTHIKFTSNDDCPVFFGVYGHFETDYGHNVDDIFTVEVEEEITESTVFRTLVDVNNNDEVHIAWNDSISLYDKEQTKEIHALVNGELQLIWERGSDEL